jgi:hypothetical protein
MTDLDNSIRALLGEALRDDAQALTVNEILNYQRVAIVGPPQRHRRSTLPYVAVAAALLLVFGLIALRDHHTSQPMAAGDSVGRYFALSQLPEGWELLEKSASAPGPESAFDRSRTTILERVDPPARLEVQAMPLDSRGFTPSNESPLHLSDGVGSWNPVQSPTRNGVAFDFARKGFAVSVQGWGLNSAEPEIDAVTAIAEAIQLDDTGVATIEPSAGFTTTTISPEIPKNTIATYSLRYGSPTDEDQFVYVTVNRLAEPVDPQVIAGPFSEQTTIAGRTVWRQDGGGAITWMPDSTLSVSIYGLGPENSVLFSHLDEITEATFAALR